MWWLVWTAAWAKAPAPKAEAWTVDELVAKNLAARGGAEALDAITSMKVTGEMVVSGGAMRLGWTRTQLRQPGSVREELTLQGFTQVSAWDGAECWQIDPFGGRKDPMRIPADDAKGLIEDVPIDGVLLDAVAKKWPTKYLGTEDIDGTPAHKIQIDRPGGDLQYVWLDPDAFLEIRVLSRRTEHGVLIEAQTDYGDYEKVAGVYFPLMIEIGPKGSGGNRATIQIEAAEANPTVDPRVFAFPTGAPPATLPGDPRTLQSPGEKP
jgi:hypothetical protein